MFFIGGINSVLPFVLYLSLIWICLVIGHGNILRGIAQPLELTSMDVHKNETQRPYVDFMQVKEEESQPSASSRNQTANLRLPALIDIDADLMMYCAIPSETGRFISFHSSTNAYRGPPLA